MVCQSTCSRLGRGQGGPKAIISVVGQASNSGVRRAVVQAGVQAVVQAGIAILVQLQVQLQVQVEIKVEDA